MKPNNIKDTARALYPGNVERAQYRMVGNFRGKSEKAPKINFRGFKISWQQSVQGRGTRHKR